MPVCPGRRAEIQRDPDRVGAPASTGRPGPRPEGPTGEPTPGARAARKPCCGLGLPRRDEFGIDHTALLREATPNKTTSVENKWG